MSWTHLPHLLAAWLVVVGMLGVVTSRNLIHLAICLGVAQSGTYVFLLAIGYQRSAHAPIFETRPPELPTVDPVAKALVLTDIVVGVTVTALLFALAIQAHRRFGTLDPIELRKMRG